jgi:hypothetical protein
VVLLKFQPFRLVWLAAKTIQQGGEFLGVHADV